MKRIIILLALAIPVILYSQTGIVVSGACLGVNQGAILGVEGGELADISFVKSAEVVNDGVIFLEGDIYNNSVTSMINLGDTYVGLVKFVGNNKQIISGCSKLEFENIVINNSSYDGLLLECPFDVKGVLNFIDGLIRTDSENILHFLPKSSCENESDDSFIHGPALKSGSTDFTFPVGKVNMYRSIGVVNLCASGTFSAEYFNYDSDLDGYNGSSKIGLYAVSDCEYWDLSTTSVSNVSATVELSYNNNLPCVVSAPEDIRVAHWKETGWISEGNSQFVDNGISGFIYSDQITNFGPFTLASISSNNILPIELLSFDSYCENGVVVLDWKTVSEKNNDYFTLEMSENGNSFKFVDYIVGAGNSSELKSYNYKLENLNGPRYFRLLQTDFDGGSEVVGKTFVNSCASDNNDISYSLFSHDQTLDLVLNAPLKEDCWVIIYDMAGREVLSDNIPAGQTDIVLKFKRIDSKLIYFLKLTSGNVNVTQKYVF